METHIDKDNKTKKKTKAKYGMMSNCAWMISTAWREREKKVLVLSVLSAFLAVAISLINTYITPMVIAAVERGAAVGELFAVIIAFALLLMLTSAASAYVNGNTLFGRITVRIGIIRMLNGKALRTSYPNLFDERFSGIINQASTYTMGNNQATEAVWTALTDLFKNTLGFVIYLCLLSSLEVWVVAVVTATCAVSFFVTNKLSSYRYEHREEGEEYDMKLWHLSRFSQNDGAAKDIRLFGMSDWIKDIRSGVIRAFTSFHSRANARILAARMADVLLTFLRNGVAYVYLVGLVLEGGISVSDFLLYFAAVGTFTTWVSGILGGVSALYRQSLDISVVREAIEYPEPFSLDEGEPLAPDPAGKYEITLKNVSFSYQGSDRRVLDGINLTIHAGEKLAVVGLNGAGKTTLVKLICGLYDPTEGEVLLNGENIKKYKRRNYYEMFSAVFQNFSLVPDTVTTNVAMSYDDVDMGRVRDAVDKAGLSDKIESLPKGYDTLLNREIYDDAVMLSGGETQRLILARALYKNAPVVVLDEPTAALDPIAEAALYEKYGDMTDSKSSVYISHRLASTRFCDRIILIKDGKIAEEGTHDELLAAGGTYAELFGVQSKYYRDDKRTDVARTDNAQEGGDTL